MKNNYEWYKQNPKDEVWWLNNYDQVGAWVFSFDQKTQFNLFADYPHKLTDTQLEIFNKENPQWRDFFKDRLKK